MPDDLNIQYARDLADRLRTIHGFPDSEAVVEATAQDLIRWCEGANLKGEWWSPEKQAEWLVTTARDEWEEWTSTADLRELFLSKFLPRTEHVPFPSRSELEKKYGPPNQEWSHSIQRAATGSKEQDFQNQLADMRQQAIRDALYYTEGSGRNEISGHATDSRHSQGFWQVAMAHHLKEHPEEVASIREQIRSGQIGPVPPPPEMPSDERKQVRSITAADVEEARRRLKSDD